MTPEFRVWDKETKKYATSTRLFGFIESDDSFKFALISLHQTYDSEVFYEYVPYFWKERYGE